MLRQTTSPMLEPLAIKSAKPALSMFMLIRLPSALATRVGSGVTTPEMRFMRSQGELKQTGAVLDLSGRRRRACSRFAMEAILRDVLYTRDGSFRD